MSTLRAVVDFVWHLWNVTVEVVDLPGGGVEFRISYSSVGELCDGPDRPDSLLPAGEVAHHADPHVGGEQQ